MRLIFNKGNFLSVGIAGLLLIGSVKAENQTPVQVETLLQSSSSWDGVPYQYYPNSPPELTVLKITIPANTELPWHTHPMPSVAYVLSGKLTVELQENGEKKTLTTGQVLPDVIEKIHRGVTGDTPAVLIVFYAGTNGMPLSHSVEQ